MLGVPVPGTKKAREYKWTKVKTVPKWVNVYSDLKKGEEQIVKGKTFIYKIKGATSYHRPQRIGSGSQMSAGVYDADHTKYKYYRRKRGLQ